MQEAFLEIDVRGEGPFNKQSAAKRRGYRKVQTGNWGVWVIENKDVY